jgi:hypothetical protein
MRISVTKYLYFSMLVLFSILSLHLFVGKIEASGISFEHILGAGGEYSAFTEPVGVAVDQQDNVYIAEGGASTRVVKLDSNGNFLMSFTAGQNGEYLHDIAVDTNGNIFVLDRWLLSKYDSAGNLIGTMGTHGSGVGQYGVSYGIALDSQNNVYIADQGNTKIHKLDNNGNWIWSIGSTYGTSDYQFGYPYGIGIDSADNIYVVDSLNLVKKFNSSGTFLYKFGTWGDGYGQFRSPQAVAVASNGDIYVTDNMTTQDGLKVFTNAGSLKQNFFLGRGSGVNQYDWAQKVAIDSTGVTYVADRYNNRVKKYIESYSITTANPVDVYQTSPVIKIGGTGSSFSRGSGLPGIIEINGVPVASFSVDLVTDRDWTSVGIGSSSSLVPSSTVLGSFEDPGFPGTNWSTGGDANWFQDSSISTAGVASATSGAIGNRSSTWLKYDLNAASSGNLTFDWQVSSEDGWDYLLFCLDNETNCADYSADASITGVGAGWASVSIPVSAGVHSLYWAYTKDGSGFDGSDSGSIDNINFVSTSVDFGSGTVVISNLNPTNAPGVSATHSLYLPKLAGQVGVIVCPNATVISEVVEGCSGSYFLNQGAPGLAVENYAGNDYWVVSGLTGTGALGVSVTPPAAGFPLVITPNNSAVSLSQEVVLSYTPPLGFVSGDKVQFHFEPTAGFVLANTCATPTTDANGDSTVDGSGTIVGADVYEYTFSGTVASSALSFCVNVTSPATAGSYSVRLTDDNGTFDSAMYYVGDDNDVFVIANVAPSLSFNIRTLADDADTNVCSFGTVSPSDTLPNYDNVDDGASECGYALAVGTNAANGFQVQITADDQLNGTSGNIADLSNGGTFSAGVEAYGLANVTSSTSGRNVTTGDYTESILRNGNFALGASTGTNIPLSATNFVSYTNGIQYVAGVDNLDTTSVVHGLVIGSGTPAGYYDQVVTYTTTANF